MGFNHRVFNFTLLEAGEYVLCHTLLVGVPIALKTTPL